MPHEDILGKDDARNVRAATRRGVIICKALADAGWSRSSLSFWQTSLDIAFDKMLTVGIASEWLRLSPLSCRKIRKFR